MYAYIHVHTCIFTYTCENLTLFNMLATFHLLMSIQSNDLITNKSTVLN